MQTVQRMGALAHDTARAGAGACEPRARRIPVLRLAATLACAAVVALAVILTALARIDSGSRPVPAGGAAARLPAGLLPAASASIGASRHAFWPVRRGASLVARGGGIASSFNASGARLQVSAGAVSVSLASVGRETRAEPVRAVAPATSAGQVVYRRGAISELYRNGPYGLEQAFTLRARPQPGHGSLVLAMRLEGALRPVQSGSQILFKAGNGQTALRYGQLSVLDAAGRELPARLRLGDRTLQLLIDDGGARYPLRIDPFFQQGGKLTGGEESGGGEFASSVGLSADGDTALVGGASDNENVGAAWVFTRTGSTWEQQGPKLTGAEESGKGRFGFRVALSADGNTALMGGPVDSAEVGAAWVFTRSEGTWTQQGGKLLGSGESGKGEFGTGVALSADGNTALIGGGGDSKATGAAWAFTRSEGTWTQQGAKLTGSGEVGEGRFGFRVALSEDGNTALVGAGSDSSGVGAAWVFTRSEGVWTQQGSKLTGSGEVGAGHFGFSLALSADGNTALIGGLADNGEVGAAWVFTRSEGVWTQQGSKLSGSGESGKGLFGYGAALSSDGNTALIGAGGDNLSVGAAWVFTRTGSTWEQLGSKLTGTGEVGSGLFGFSVALSSAGTTALIGGPMDNGAVGAAWVFVDKLEAPTAVTGVASGITQSSATLNATVNPNGGHVSDCHFNYGTTIEYGSSAPCTSLPGSGTEPVAVSATVSGLSANTTYHFQIVATNPTGTAEGGDQTFTTASPPEYGRCLKLAKGVKGKYSTAACTIPATPEKFAFEWERGPGPKTKFTTKIKSETVATFETVGKKLVVCKGETSSGEFTGLKTVGSVVFTFTGCEMAGVQCTSSGAAEGELVTKTLEGVIGIEKKSLEGPIKDKTAMDLFPIGGPGTLLEYTCGETAVTVRGSMLNPVAANKMLLTSTVKWNASGGKQKPEKFEGQPKDVLETAFGEGPFEQSALKLTTIQTNEEKIELNTVV
jgi:hypothetical protein